MVYFSAITVLLAVIPEFALSNGGSSFAAAQNGSALPVPCQPSCVATEDIVSLCNKTASFPQCVCRDIYGAISADCLTCLTCNNYTNAAEIVQNVTTEYNMGCQAAGISITPISVNTTC